MQGAQGFVTAVAVMLIYELLLRRHFTNSAKWGGVKHSVDRCIKAYCFDFNFKYCAVWKHSLVKLYLVAIPIIVTPLIAEAPKTFQCLHIILPAYMQSPVNSNRL